MTETNPHPRTTEEVWGVMRGNMTQVHEEFTCLKVKNFSIFVAQLMLAHDVYPLMLWSCLQYLLCAAVYH